MPSLLTFLLLHVVRKNCKCGYRGGGEGAKGGEGEEIWTGEVKWLLLISHLTAIVRKSCYRERGAETSRIKNFQDR